MIRIHDQIYEELKLYCKGFVWVVVFLDEGIHVDGCPHRCLQGHQHACIPVQTSTKTDTCMHARTDTRPHGRPRGRTYRQRPSHAPSDKGADAGRRKDGWKDESFDCLTNFDTFLLWLTMCPTTGRNVFSRWNFRIKVVKSIQFISCTCALTQKTSLCDIKPTRISRHKWSPLKQTGRHFSKYFFITD